jgi:hypothetical protein
MFYEEALAGDVCRAAKREVASLADHGQDCSLLLLILRLWRYRDDELLNLLADEIISRWSTPAAALAGQSRKNSSSNNSRWRGDGGADRAWNKTGSNSSSSGSISIEQLGWSFEQIEGCCCSIAAIGYNQPKQQKLHEVLVRQYIAAVHRGTLIKRQRGVDAPSSAKRLEDEAVWLYRQGLSGLKRTVRVLWSCAVLGFTGAAELRSLVCLVCDCFDMIATRTGSSSSSTSNSSTSSYGSGSQQVGNGRDNGSRGNMMKSSGGSGSSNSSVEAGVEEVMKSIDDRTLCQLHQAVMFLEVSRTLH